MFRKIMPVEGEINMNFIAGSVIRGSIGCVEHDPRYD